MVDDPGGTPHEWPCEECEEVTVHNTHYRCLECRTVNAERCDKCGNPSKGLIQTGDRGGGPELCGNCYFIV